MTTDIRVRWSDGEFIPDFIFENNDFQTDEGIANAVLISLFTDQRASDEDPIPNSDLDYIDKRGWWGDLVDSFVEGGDQIGSKLWLLDRSKVTNENLALAVEYAENALQWMIDDGIIKDRTVISERMKLNNQDVLTLLVEVQKINGNKINISFDPGWFATLASDYV